SAAWTEVGQRIFALKNKYHKFSVSGSMMYGFVHPSIAKLIQVNTDPMLTYLGIARSRTLYNVRTPGVCSENKHNNPKEEAKI
ncbi:hypothetical protein, partial [Vibrio cholerae]|uniref:hypothetical protein n=1 Tax=Vibrio cholerae TaxID=666 RepID=UPI001F15D004